MAHGEFSNKISKGNRKNDTAETRMTGTKNETQQTTMGKVDIHVLYIYILHVKQILRIYIYTLYITSIHMYLSLSR